MKKMVALATAASLTFILTACGNSGKDAGNDGEPTDVTIDQITLGEDYTDLDVDLKFVTNQTDIIDTKLQQYINDFQKIYPNINIEYEGVTDYINDITTRISTKEWGDICMLPTTVDKSALGDYFLPLGDRDTLSEVYILLNNFAYDNICYGLPSMGNINGIVYNKDVFSRAGITELPKTPDEFIDALQKIKDHTQAIPLYTNFSAGWPMAAWDSYIGGCATGDAGYIKGDFLKGENPFSDRGDGTGPYAVYEILYEAVSKGLTEDDPNTTDWEGSKGMLNRGDIGCMVLGSWSIPQIQQAGENADNIAYMPFPITVDGKQYVMEGPDYYYGINVNSSQDKQIAAMCYIKFLVEESGYAESQGGIDCVAGKDLPEEFSAFESDQVEIIVEEPAAEGEETLFDDVNNDSELGITVSGACLTEIVENAVTGEKTLDDLVNEWNTAWTAAQEENGIMH